jgi:hypothetical protein
VEAIVPTIVQRREGAKQEAARERERWEAEARERERQEQTRRRAEALRASRKQLLAIVGAWSLAHSTESFFEDADRRGQSNGMTPTVDPQYPGTRRSRLGPNRSTARDYSRVIPGSEVAPKPSTLCARQLARLSTSWATSVAVGLFQRDKLGDCKPDAGFGERQVITNAASMWAG